MTETKIQRSKARLEELKLERLSWEQHWKDLGQHFMPRKGRWMLDAHEVNRGDKRNQKLLDGTPRYAARTLASGMMSGLTSPARPWFRLVTPDASLMESAAVKEWLEIVESRMRDVFAKSNIYNVLPTIYGELGVIGTAAFIILDDEQDIIRARPYTVGSYYLANSSRLMVDTFYCEYAMTVRQIAQEYVRQPNGSMDWSRVTAQTKSLYESNQLNNWIPVVHLVEPNADRENGKSDNKNMPFRSCYFEKAQGEDIFLRESGFEEFPIMAPRWETTGEDVYGSSPGMDTLGDAKALQHQTKQKAKVMDKIADPPMAGHTSLQNKKSSILPGDLTFVDFANGTPQFQPVYVPNPQAIGAIREDIENLRQLISRGMYEDLFLMLANSDRRDITAREVAEKHEEKLLMLGPVLERLNDEQHDPLIDRTFNIMLRRGMIPPPPEELQGEDVKVEYISILAQAQKMVATGGIERLANYVGAIAAFQPDAVDKFDADQSIDEYGTSLGVPAKVIRSDDAVASLREARQQQQAAQQAAAIAQPMKDMATAAKTASETQVGGKSALDQVVGL